MMGAFAQGCTSMTSSSVVAGVENESAVSRRKWRTPQISVDIIQDMTRTVILAPGVDNYEASSPNDGS